MKSPELVGETLSTNDSLPRELSTASAPSGAASPPVPVALLGGSALTASSGFGNQRTLGPQQGQASLFQLWKKGDRFISANLTRFCNRLLNKPHFKF